MDDGAPRARHLVGADGEAVQRDVLALEQAARRLGLFPSPLLA